MTRCTCGHEADDHDASGCIVCSCEAFESDPDDDMPW